MRATLPSRFFAWWFGELRSLMPRRWRSVVGRHRQALVVEVTGETAKFRHRHGATWHEIGQVPLHDRAPAAARQMVQQLLRESKARAGDVVLCWSADLAPRRTIELPLAAAEDLREVLSFEMDRFTPFKAEQVYFAYAREQSDRAAQQLRVDLFVIPRAVADPILRTIRSWGLNPARMSVTAAEGDALEDIDLTPLGSEPNMARFGRPVSITLAVCAGLLAIGAIYLPLHRQQDALAALEEKLARARAEVAQVEVLKQKIGELQDRNRFLVERKQLQPSIMDIMAELTRVLPDDTWIVELSVRSGNISLSGYSGSTSTLIRLLEQSDLFDQVRFSSPVTQDTRFDTERFNISASVFTKGEPT